VTLNGESTGLVCAQSIRCWRAFMMTPAISGTQTSYQVLAFARGAPAGRACRQRRGGGRSYGFSGADFFNLHARRPAADHRDLQTSRDESGLGGKRCYDDHEIADTRSNCLSCHQPGGPRREDMRIAELAKQWAHWFYSRATRDAAGGDRNARPNPRAARSYAGSRRRCDASRACGADQPGPETTVRYAAKRVDTLKINSEMARGGTSATWAALYANAVAGQEIAAVVLSNPPSDRAKEQAATAA